MKEVLHYAVEQSPGQCKAEGQSQIDDDAAESQSSEVKQPIDALEKCRNLVQELEEQVEDAYQCKYNALMDLKELEHKMLREWQTTKKESETKSKMHAAWEGLHLVSKAVLMWLEWQKRHPDGFGGATTAPSTTTAGESKSCGAAESGRVEEDPANAPGLATRSDAQGRVYPPEVVDGQHAASPEAVPGTDRVIQGPENPPPILSDVIMEGITDPKEREAILKKEHRGSADHPNGCRACHFQGGLCWKGLACSFCHICPKPKRKSKHQRDVDKRRQERYRQVKDDLGIECLDELTKIDETRRQLMTSSEELKKRVKDAYATEDRQTIADVKLEVSQLMDQCQVTMPGSPESSDKGEPPSEEEDEVRGDAIQKGAHMESTSKHSLGSTSRSSRPVPVEEGQDVSKDGGAMGSGDAELPAQASKVRRPERLPRQQVSKQTWQTMMPYGTSAKTIMWPAPEEGQLTEWEHTDWHEQQQQQQQLPHKHRQSDWWSHHSQGYGQHQGSDSHWWSQAWQPPPPGTWSMEES